MKLVFALAVSLFAACGGDDGDAAPVRLQALPLDLAAVDYPAILAHRALFDGPNESYPISDYRHVSMATESQPSKTNPQPTFWGQAGMKVRAPITGQVRSVDELYSGDFTILFDGGPSRIWETEHVIDVLVAEGDMVEAGQEVGTLSDYECTYARDEFGNDAYCGIGVGIVEFGLSLPRSDGQATHGCPFTDEELDPAAKATIEADLAAARTKIEAELGDPTFFDQVMWESTNCVGLAPIDA